MELSIKEAAEVLGKSERTVRHMAQTGRLPARRIGSRWIIHRADLSRRDLSADPASTVEDGDPEAEVAEARGPAAESAPPRATPAPRRPTLTVSFEPVTAETDSRHFPSSVRELDTFTIATGLLAALADARRDGRNGHGDEALLADPEQALRRVLQILADGCHQPDARRKAACFRDAQTQACAALSGLVHYNLIHPDPDLAELAERVESELLASLGDLRASNDRRLTWRGRAITVAEIALERIIHRAKAMSGAGRLAERLDHVERSLHRALRHAL